MQKYSEITLNEEEKKILEWFKSQGYTHISRSTVYGFIECIDEKTDIQCSLKPMRKPFEFIENGERYDIEKLLNPPKEENNGLDMKKGMEYWFVDTTGSVFYDYWENRPMDKAILLQGNVFLTKEEAVFESKRRGVVTKVRKYARPYIPNKDNYFPYYDGNYKCIQISCTCDCYYDMLSFNSYVDIHKAIDEVGEDDFKKYYLKVIDYDIKND